MSLVFHALRAGLFIGIILLLIGVTNVGQTPLFMAFLAALVMARFLELSGPGKALLATRLADEDKSRITTWIIGATFITNMVVPILHYRYSKPLPEVGWWNWLGLLIMIAGSALRLWSIQVAGESFKAQIAVSAKHRLATSGPYAWVRHPAYLGTIIFYLGVTAIFWSSWGLAALLIVVVPTFVVRLFKEERILEAHFGEEWRRYAAQTGSMLFPGL